MYPLKTSVFPSLASFKCFLDCSSISNGSSEFSRHPPKLNSICCKLFSQIDYLIIILRAFRSSFSSALCIMSKGKKIIIPSIHERKFLKSNKICIKWWFKVDMHTIWLRTTFDWNPVNYVAFLRILIKSKTLYSFHFYSFASFSAVLTTFSSTQNRFKEVKLGLCYGW